MKKIITILLFALFSLNLVAAETLSFKFSNPRIFYSDGVSYLDFDVLMKATSGDTYLYGAQVICNVNITNFNTSTNPQFLRGFIGGLYQDEDFKYLYTTSWNSDKLNLAVYANPLYNGQAVSSGAYSQVTNAWQLLGRVRVKIINTDGVAGINFLISAMNGFQTYATGVGPFYSATYNNPNQYEGYDFTDLYMGRIFSGGSGWTQAGGILHWSVPVNTSVWDTTAAAAIAGSDAMAYNLRIHPGGRLLVNPGENLTVTGTLTNASNSGNNGLVLKSDVTGTGSLLHNTAGVSAIVERYITAAAWSEAADGWHLLSSPVVSQSISGTWTPAGTGNDYDFFAFDETEINEYEYWLNQKLPANDITSFLPGKGYLVAYQQSGLRKFTGILNSNDISPAFLTYTPGSQAEGWNLVGNPFPCAINWTNGTWTKNNIDAEAQVWVESAQSYKTTMDISVNNIIPSMNGFMVHASTSGATLTIPADARIHNSTNWYKSGEEDFILLLANDTERGSSQSSIIRFNPAATNEYDTKFDSYFMSGFAPMFYSVSGNQAFALNTLPQKEHGLAIPFSFIKNGSSNFNIELAKNIPGTAMYLEDRKTATIQNLVENPVYNFTAAGGDDANRFVLHFGTEGISDGSSNANFSVWYYDGYIHFSALPADILELSLVDISGRNLISLNKATSDKISIGNGFAPGWYLVKLTLMDNIVIKKIFINN